MLIVPTAVVGERVAGLPCALANARRTRRAAREPFRAFSAPHGRDGACGDRAFGEAVGRTSVLQAIPDGETRTRTGDPRFSGVRSEAPGGVKSPQEPRFFGRSVPCVGTSQFVIVCAQSRRWSGGHLLNAATAAPVRCRASRRALADGGRARPVATRGSRCLRTRARSRQARVDELEERVVGDVSGRHDERPARGTVEKVPVPVRHVRCGRGVVPALTQQRREHPGAPEAPMTWVATADVTAATLAAIDRDVAGGFVLAADRATGDEVADVLGRVLGRPVRWGRSRPRPMPTCCARMSATTPPTARAAPTRGSLGSVARRHVSREVVARAEVGEEPRMLRRPAEPVPRQRAGRDDVGGEERGEPAEVLRRLGGRDRGERDAQSARDRRGDVARRDSPLGRAVQYGAGRRLLEREPVQARVRCR